MRKTVFIVAVLLAAAPLWAADSPEVIKLRAEKEALEDKFKLLLDRLDKIETELSKLRLQMSRDMRGVEDQLARIDAGSTRVASGENGNNSNNPPNLFTGPRPPTPAPPIRPEVTDPPPSTTVARVEQPRIPDPFLPTQPNRPRVDRPKGTPTTVAVVDMLKLFNSLKEKEAIEESLKDLVYAVKFEDQKWQRKIGEISLDMRLLAQGSAAYIEKNRQMETARIDWNVSLAAAKTRLDRRRGELLKALYTKMTQAVGRVADQNGYDMVLYKESTPAYEAFANVGELLNTRMVVKAADSVELTEQVIRMLNGEYERANFRADAGR